jgi:hypothetical protein
MVAKPDRKRGHTLSALTTAAVVSPLTFSHKIGIQAGQGIFGCIRVSWVDESKMQQVTFFAIDVCDKFATLEVDAT